MSPIVKSPERDREKIFLALLKQLGLPHPHREFTFASPRRWRFDYAWPEYSVALEVDGGIFVGGRHARGAGIMKTHEKQNAAAALGWRILYTVPRLLCSDELLIRLEQALKHSEAA